MIGFNVAAVKAIARLKAYVPPVSQYYNLPLSRRAAVIILLFADKNGNLKAVLTIRSPSLNSYAGQAALPGGKADTLAESAFQTARREASEEIGLPLTGPLPGAFTVEHLCQLPTYLARTEIGVRPCVALLSPRKFDGPGARSAATLSAEERLIPQLNPKEVAAVFTAPFHDFLKTNGNTGDGCKGTGNDDSTPWYNGIWTQWYGQKWRMHSFHVPTTGQIVRKPDVEIHTKVREDSTEAFPRANESVRNLRLPYQKETRKETLNHQSYFKVFGLTARILVDAACVSYDETPDFEHNPRFGDEELIKRMLGMGKLGPTRKKDEKLERQIATIAKM